MKKIIILLLIGAVALMGYYDGGDITAAVVMGLLMLPAIAEKKPSPSQQGCATSPKVRGYRKEGKKCQTMQEA